MDEQQFLALVEEIGAERMLFLIQLISQMTDEQKQQMTQALAQIVESQRQGGPAAAAPPEPGMGGPPPEQMQAPAGPSNLYG